MKAPGTPHRCDRDNGMDRRDRRIILNRAADSAQNARPARYPSFSTVFRSHMIHVVDPVLRSCDNKISSLCTLQYTIPLVLVRIILSFYVITRFTLRQGGHDNPDGDCALHLNGDFPAVVRELEENLDLVHEGPLKFSVLFELLPLFPLPHRRTHFF